MPIHINAVCDDCKKFCSQGQFDDDDETCGDLKSHLETLGWIVSDGEGTKDVTLACPACANLRT
jgi:hypothetical protein